MLLWISARISENRIPRVVRVKIDTIELLARVKPTAIGRCGIRKTFVKKTDGT